MLTLREKKIEVKTHRPPEKSGCVVNAFTVDVEDYFHVRAFADVIEPREWDSLQPTVDKNTQKLLRLLSDKSVKGTFFVLGWVAERFPALIREIASEGHEIASHGYAHALISDQTKQEYSDDIRRSKAVLEDITSSPVIGYRAPTFSLNEKTFWAYNFLEEAGYHYSSSIYPIAHDLYGMPNASRHPFHPNGTKFKEIPLTTVRLFGRNFPAAGGGYFRLLPYRATAWSMQRTRSADASPCVFYCHPWEIDPHQPRVSGASLKARLRHYLNLNKTEKRLSRLLDDFSWGRMDEAFL